MAGVLGHHLRFCLFGCLLRYSRFCQISRQISDACQAIYTKSTHRDHQQNECGDRLDIYIKDKGTAHRNDVLLTFRSTLDEDDLGRLNAFFDDIDRVAYIPQYLTIAFPKGLHLGSLSPSYTSMMQNYEEFQHFLKQSAVFVKIKALSNEIEQIHKLNRSLTKQEEFFEQDVALTEKDFGRFQTLKEQGVIADVEKERAQSKILNEKRNLEAFRSQKLNNEVRIEQLKTQISDLSSDRSSRVSTRIFAIHQMKERLLNEIKEWEELHIVKSPFDANIAYKSYLTKSQFVKAGDVLLNCIPHNTGNSYIAQGKLPLRAWGHYKLDKMHYWNWRVIQQHSLA